MRPSWARSAPATSDTVPGARDADRGGAPALVERLSDAATRLNAMLDESNKAHVDSILHNLDDASGQLKTAIADISQATQGIAAVGRSLQDFAGQFDGIGPRTTAALDSVRGAADQLARTGKAVEDMRLPAISAQAEGILSDLRRMLGSEDAAALPRLTAAGRPLICPGARMAG